MNLGDRRLEVYQLAQKILDTGRLFRVNQSSREVRLLRKRMREENALQSFAALLPGQQAVELFRRLAPDLSRQLGVEEDQGELEGLC